MRFEKKILIWSTLIGMSFLHACSEPRNFDDEIHAADSLKNQLDKTLALIDTSVLNITDSINQQLRFFQANYPAGMESVMAQTLLRYDYIRKSVTLLDQWKDSLHNRQDKIENELIAFRNALADKATHDGLNHEINELYADTVLQNLIDKQQQWHSKINEWKQRQQSIYNNWNALNDTLLIWRQSIPKQNQPS
jgi:hypothetical protein